MEKLRYECDDRGYNSSKKSSDTTPKTDTDGVPK